MDANLETGFLLDRRWHLLRGEMQSTKKPVLIALARILLEAGAPYAIIGGIAVQVHRREPRTTLDIDLAVLDREAIPAQRLIAAGFRETGRFAHSVNWVGDEATPVQFTDDPLLATAVVRAQSIDLDGVPLRVIRPEELLHEKLRAGSDPSRRRSKRLQDLADAEGLLEDRPGLEAELRDDERALLARYRG